MMSLSETESALSSLRQERDSLSRRRTTVDERLTAVNKQVDAMRNAVQGIKASLPFISQKHIQEQIKNLQYQMDHQPYRPSEERRLVSEIDRLRRAEKRVKELDRLKLQLETLREEQKVVRDERDEVFRLRTRLKTKEDELKRQRRTLLIQQERQLQLQQHVIREDVVGEARAHAKVGRSESNGGREGEQKRHRKGDRRRFRSTDKESEEPAAEKELRLLNQLINVCLRLEGPIDQCRTSASTATTPLSPNGPNAFGDCNGKVESNNLLKPFEADLRRGSHESALRPKTQDEAFARSVSMMGDRGVTAYRKGDQCSEFFSGVCKKGGKAARKERKKAKPLSLDPDSLQAFFALGINPPAMCSDIASTLKHLELRKETLNHQKENTDQAKNADGTENVSANKAPQVIINGLEPANGIQTDSAPEKSNAEATTLPPVNELAIADLSEESFPSLPQPLVNSDVLRSDELGKDNKNMVLNLASTTRELMASEGNMQAL